MDSDLKNTIKIKMVNQVEEEIEVDTEEYNQYIDILLELLTQDDKDKIWWKICIPCRKLYLTSDSNNYLHKSCSYNVQM